MSKKQLALKLAINGICSLLSIAFLIWIITKLFPPNQQIAYSALVIACWVVFNIFMAWQIFTDQDIKPPFWNNE